MVAAANRWAFDRPARKRKMPVATAILEGCHLAAGTKENDRLFEQGSGDRFFLELPGEPGHIPAIERKHAGSIARLEMRQNIYEYPGEKVLIGANPGRGLSART